MKEKVNELLRSHEAKQEKIKTESYSKQIQILTLVLDKLSQKYCSDYFNVFKYLIQTAHEFKQVGKILPAPKMEKLPPMKHFIW